MADQRIVYGAVCVWWGSIADVDRTPSGLPCCPHCGGVLFEMESERAWWVQVDDYARRQRNPGYRAFVEWLRGRCFPTYQDALAVYDHDGSS